MFAFLLCFGFVQLNEGEDCCIHARKLLYTLSFFEVEWKVKHAFCMILAAASSLFVDVCFRLPRHSEVCQQTFYLGRSIINDDLRSVSIFLDLARSQECSCTFSSMSRNRYRRLGCQSQFKAFSRPQLSSRDRHMYQ